jgi:hypothetical protein
MPLIITVIAVMVSAAAIFVGVVGSELGGMADGFCFSGDTLVVLNDGSYKKIADISYGDILYGGSEVKGTLIFKGNNVTLFDYKGIKVSGEHLVYHNNSKWMKVINTNSNVIAEEELIYSLVTSDNRIPVISDIVKHNDIIIFADWDEFSDDSKEGNEWHTIVQNSLRVPGRLRRSPCGSAHLGENTVIYLNGEKSVISKARLGDKINDINSSNTTIIGIYETYDNMDILMSPGVWKWDYCYWHQGNSGFSNTINKRKRYHLITNTGTFYINDDKDHLIRDFTEIGVPQLKLVSSQVVDMLSSLKSL